MGHPRVHGLFFFIGYSILLIGRSLKAKSHVDIVRFTNGRVLGFFIDAVITVFLFGGLSAMIAGAGAVFKEQFSLAPVWGTLAMAAVTLLTVTAGIRGVINAISYVVPFLLVSVLYISILSLAGNPVTPQEIEAAKALPGATPHWLLSAVNYASYNIVISIGVLAPMGACTPDSKKLLAGAILGAAGLGLGLAAIYFCVLTNVTDAGALELPMIEAAGRISGALRLAFAIVLFAEVYTTAVGNLYAFSERVSLKISKKALIAGVTVLALLAGQLGFSTMVRFLYPAVGYAGIVFFAGVVYVWTAKRKAVTQGPQ